MSGYPVFEILGVIMNIEELEIRSIRIEEFAMTLLRGNCPCQNPCLRQVVADLLQLGMRVAIRKEYRFQRKLDRVADQIIVRMREARALQASVVVAKTDSRRDDLGRHEVFAGVRDETARGLALDELF